MKNKSSNGLRRYGRSFVVLASVTALLSSLLQGLAAELLAGVADGDKLVLFASDDPRDVEVVKIRGLPRRERILGLDLRPLSGELYAFGSSARLYTINILTGQATEIGSGPFTNALIGTKFGFDFNPTVDRIRIVSDAGVNLRVNPTNGLLAAVDGMLAYATNDVNAGRTPRVVGAAYINNDTNPATGTVLFDIDSSADVLVMQNPPNSGTLVTVGLLGYDVKEAVGFDVAGTDGIAYASLVVKRHHRSEGRSRDRDDDDDDDQGKEDHERAHLFIIDLLTGAATPIGRIGGPKPLTSLTALGTIQ